MLTGLETLRGLKSLRLGNLKRLRSLSAIEQLTNLESLEMHACPLVRSIDQVSHLRQLKKLYLIDDGKIESLAPLSKISGLEEVLFYESTNILDGDLSPLTHQRNLLKVSFQNRRHYSHKREDFGRASSG